MSRLPFFNFIPGPPPGPPHLLCLVLPIPPSSPFVFGSPSPFVFGSPLAPHHHFLETHFSDFELMDEGKLMDNCKPWRLKHFLNFCKI